MSDSPVHAASPLPIATIAGPGLPALDPQALAPLELATALTGIAPPQVPTMNRLGELRQVYWQNVMREMLATFAMLSRRDPGIGDGRVSVMTTQGERIPIAGIEPLFPCSVVDNERDRQLCMAVQFTVFNITTPVGEIVTLPLHEITSVRVLSNELLKQLEAVATESSPRHEGEPFGFAAYTSLARQDAQNKQRPEGR